MNDLDFFFDDPVISQYYEGVLMDRWTTKGDNLMIRVKEVKRINSVEGVIVKTKGKLPELNFLVPKRRTNVLEKAKRIEIGKQIQVKLLKESRSGKFALAKINY